MPAPALSAPPSHCVLLAFNANNQLAVRQFGPELDLPFVGIDESTAVAGLELTFPTHTLPAEHFRCSVDGPDYRVFFTQVQGEPAQADIAFRTLDDLQHSQTQLSATLASVLAQLEPHLIEVPYLHLGEN